MIVIKVPPEEVTVAFESTKAPCRSCRHYRGDLYGDDYRSCGKVNRQITSDVLTQCEKENWRREAQ